MNKVYSILGAFLISLYVMVGTSFLIAFLLRWLWNMTPPFQNICLLTYWQAFRIFIIAQILIKGVQTTVKSDN